MTETIKYWYYQESDEDQRAEHHSGDVPELQELADLGVEFFNFSPTDYDQDDAYLKLMEDRGFNYTDTVNIAPDTLANYEEKIKIFFEEHLHNDDEIRFMLDGGGYFDVRDHQDRWIRMECKPGNMIILPRGIYHRFTLNENNYCKCMRLFCGEPVWIPHNRPQEDHPAREYYLDTFLTNNKKRARDEESTEQGEKRIRLDE